MNLAQDIFGLAYLIGRLFLQSGAKAIERFGKYRLEAPKRRVHRA